MKQSTMSLILEKFLYSIGLVQAKQYDELFKDNTSDKARITTFKTEIKHRTKMYNDMSNHYDRMKIALSANPKAEKRLKKEQESKTKLRAWSKRVREVGQCDVCESSEKLTAHHLYDKNTHSTLKYQDENGVCLCETCHNNFHKMYTAASQTTPKQYEKFKIITLNGTQWIS